MVRDEEGMGLKFNAFNWKHGGQVFLQCTFNACQGSGCLSDGCQTRQRREIISLKANFIGKGHVKQGKPNIPL